MQRGKRRFAGLTRAADDVADIEDAILELDAGPAAADVRARG
jgi:hypothetical protein